MKSILLFFSILLLSLTLKGQEDSEWKIVKNSDNIKTYVKNGHSSEIKKVKAETVIKATLAELIAIIKDAESHNKWVFLNENSKILEETDDFNWKYYGITDAPWPVSNRDYITIVHLEQDEKDCSITITSTSIPGFLPEDKEFVRINYLYSVWVFSPIGDGNVHLSFEIEIDPGGNIPVWLINMVVSKGPFKTVEGLVKEIGSGKYNCTKINYIKEFDLQ